ncbi:hypothetical protein [Pseudomonas putida]|uniref:Uncharacterized protein n=1 Tax=Pseudomonas putida TaxID=303 RepID=A0A1L7NQ12_PSEPU|nr:hypothetical protein [Pseudomonas putida]BAW27533.1 Uncharacterized protein KF715C_pC1000 [Pseudomonas putida]
MSERDFKFAQDCLAEELSKFNEAWEVVRTDIHCRDCGAYQSVIDAGQPFAHAYAGCSNHRDFARHPWDELRRTLERLPDLIRHTPK